MPAERYTGSAMPDGPTDVPEENTAAAAPAAQPAPANVLEYVSRLRKIGRCLDCHAPLECVSDGRCPVCGRMFDPNNRASMHMGALPGRTGRFLLTPVGRPTHIAAVMGMLLMLCGASAPGGYFYIVGLAMLIWLGVGGSWTFRLIAGFAASISFGRPFSTWCRHWRQGVIAPSLALITLVLIASHAPLYVAFQISRPAMDRLARQTMASPAPPQRRWVGVFPIDKIEKTRNGMRFQVLGAGGPFSTAGFIYSSGGRVDDYYGYSHYSGNWYRWSSGPD